jgi:hypothetical protein
MSAAVIALIAALGMGCLAAWRRYNLLAILAVCCFTWLAVFIAATVWGVPGT